MKQEELQEIRAEWVDSSTFTDEGESYQRIVDSLLDEIERLRKALRLINNVTDYESTIYEITLQALEN